MKLGGGHLPLLGSIPHTEKDPIGSGKRLRALERGGRGPPLQPPISDFAVNLPKRSLLFETNCSLKKRIQGLWQLANPVFLFKVPMFIAASRSGSG